MSACCPSESWHKHGSTEEHRTLLRNYDLAAWDTGWAVTQLGVHDRSDFLGRPMRGSVVIARGGAPDINVAKVRAIEVASLHATFIKLVQQFEGVTNE